MFSRTLLCIAALACASAHVSVSPARVPSAILAGRRVPRASAAVSMVFGKGGGKKVDYDLTDLGPLTKEKRDVYKADRTPKTEYVPDNLAWDGSSLYVLMVPFLIVVCLSLFGGVNLFG